MLENKINLTRSASNETRQKILLQNIIKQQNIQTPLVSKEIATDFTMLASLSGLRSNVIKDTWALTAALTAPGCLTIRQCPCSMHISCHVGPPTSQARITEIFPGFVYQSGASTQHQSYKIFQFYS